jgi:hypothetical protein
MNMSNIRTTERTDSDPGFGGDHKWPVFGDGSDAVVGLKSRWLRANTLANLPSHPRLPHLLGLVQMALLAFQVRTIFLHLLQVRPAVQRTRFLRQILIQHLHLVHIRLVPIHPGRTPLTRQAHTAMVRRPVGERQLRRRRFIRAGGMSVCSIRRGSLPSTDSRARSSPAAATRGHGRFGSPMCSRRSKMTSN